jgi:hypothetical protein
MRVYGDADGEVVAVVSTVLAGLDVVVVVVVSVEVLGLAAGVTVSVFCSHAASNAAPAKMQMSFFIGVVGVSIFGQWWIGASILFGLIYLRGLKRGRIGHVMGLGNRLAGEFPIARVDAAGQGRSLPTRFF